MLDAQSARAPERSVLSSAVAVARPPHESLPAALEAAARLDAPYLVLHHGREPEPLPARAALEGARRWAAALHAAGVARGDRVPLLLPTGPAFVQSFLGSMLLGAIPVPLSSPLTFGKLDRYLDHLAHVIEDARATCLVTSERIARAARGADRLRRALRTVITPEQAASAEGVAPLRSIDPSDVALLQYTSGTTDRPKGVAISQRALVSNAFSIADALGLGPSDVGVSWLPLFHDMGLVGSLITPLCHPFLVHVLPPESFIMRPRRWLTMITELGATVSPAPNFAYELCVERYDGPQNLQLDGWRAALNGAEAVHATTLERFEARYRELGFDADAMTPVYGLAESTLAVTFPRLDAGPVTLRVDGAALERGRLVPGRGAGSRELVSVGQPVAGTSVRIADEGGAVHAQGRVGEIQVRGPSLMDGYFGNEVASAEVLVDGWLRTGDLGAVVDGRLFVCGRAKDVVVQAGRNIYPDDVERVARQIPQVRGGAAAFAAPCAARGTEELVVVVEVASLDAEVRQRTIRAVRGEILAELGVRVDHVAVWGLGSLPRTTSGKVQRGACVARWRERST